VVTPNDASAVSAAQTRARPTDSAGYLVESDYDTKEVAEVSTATLALAFHNTMSGKVEPFVPADGQNAKIYFCGPTVYSEAHIGNMRAYLFSDLLRRTIRFAGYDVDSVMNITDVGHLVGDGDDGEDKLQVKAKAEKTTAWDIAEKYTELFFTDTDLLNIWRPDTVLRATDAIQEQIDLVTILEEKGVTYSTDDGIYFDTAKIDNYGKMTPNDTREAIDPGNRIALGGKRNPTDFALWKFSPADAQRDMEWDSPWGVGFPGWHIECSAMAMKVLGNTLDIHVGGIDHIPIHHTNEIAQSETATGEEFSRFWLHCAFLTLADGDKMSKSSGGPGLLTVRQLSEQGFDPLDYRYLVLTSHYRSELAFSLDNLRAAATARERMARRVRSLVETVQGDLPSIDDDPTYLEFCAALAEDLNSPQAIAAVWTRLRDDSADPASTLAVIAKVDQVLGLELLERAQSAGKGVPDDVVALAEERIAKRAERDFAAADALRDQIKELGYEVLDSADGYTFEKI